MDQLVFRRAQIAAKASTIVLGGHPAQALPDFVAAGHYRAIQWATLTGSQVLVQLFEAGGAEDDRIHVGLAQQPPERQLDQRLARVTGNLAQLLDGLKVLLVPVPSLVQRVVVEPRAARGRGGARMLAREQSTRQRIVRNHRYAEPLAKRHVLVLDAAGQQVVHWLRNVRRLEAVLFRNPENLA